MILSEKNPVLNPQSDVYLCLIVDACISLLIDCIDVAFTIAAQHTLEELVSDSALQNRLSMARLITSVHPAQQVAA